MCRRWAVFPVAAAVCVMDRRLGTALFYRALWMRRSIYINREAMGYMYAVMIKHHQALRGQGKKVPKGTMTSF